MKPRRPTTFEAAITKIMGDLGDDACGSAIGKSAALIRKFADPDCDSLPNLAQAFSLDAAYVRAGLGDAPIGAVYRELISQITVPPLPTIDPAERLMTVMSEVGQVANAIRASIHPESPGGEARTSGECRDIIAEAVEAVDALQALIRDLDAERSSARSRPVSLMDRSRHRSTVPG